MASAQTASQITPPSYAPPVAQSGTPLVIPSDSGTQAPPGADNAEVTLADVAIEGGVVSPDALAALKERLVGKRVKVAELFATARDLRKLLRLDPLIGFSP